jgi:diguanylate cyclase (GGDEF)-like protein
MFHALSIRLGRSERTFQVERISARVGYELTRRLGRRRVGEVTVAAATDLLGRSVPAVVAVGPADRLEVVAATPGLGPAIGALLAFDGARVRLAEPGRAQAGAQAIAPVLDPPVLDPPVLDREPRAALALPIAAHDALHGVLVLVLDAPAAADPALRAALDRLCNKAGLALANAALDAELTSMAFHDPLTRLPNRALLAEQTDTALARAARSGTAIALLVLDLDGFKRINDQLGHRAGDETLRIVVARLRDQLRDADVAARLGGDEFAVLLADLADPAEATTVARRIIGALGEPFRLGDQQHAKVGASLGIVTWSAPSSPPGMDSPKEGSVPELDGLLHDADAAMYLAKRRGTGYELVSGQRRKR